MRFLLAMSIVLTLATISVAQVPGRREFLRQQAERKRAALQAKVQAKWDWNEAKKLSRRKGEDYPYREVKSLRKNELQPETVGWIVTWPLEVLDVLDDKNCLLISRNYGTLWLTGYDTKGLVDGESVRVYDPVEMVGTKEYQAVSGSTPRVKQIRLLAAEEESEWLAEERERMSKQREQEKLAEYPEWTSRVGSTVRAKFLRYAGGRVHMETIKGRELRLKLSDFSDESANRLRELIQEASEDD